MFDLDTLRDWLARQPSIRYSNHSARLDLFDRYRYEENYEAIYEWVVELGWMSE